MSAVRPTGSSEPPRRFFRPAALVPLVLVVAAQAVCLGIGAFSMLLGLITGDVWSVPGAVFLTVVFGGGCLWLLSAARGLWRGKRWPRAAALTAQLFSVVAAGAILAPFTPLGAGALVLAAAVAMVCLFTPAVVDWTTQDLHAR
ncbi:MAG: hypothetical protein Q4C81_03290 [Kocuria sp.]|nr:hypothetical protein [Kocuria sp.]